MAKTRLNAALRELRGTIDGIVYRDLNGQNVASRLPRHKKRQRGAAETATKRSLRRSGHLGEGGTARPSRASPLATISR
jgi:hypothetical protein